MNEYAARSEELKQAASMILQESSKAGIETRLLGGMAVYLTSPCTHDEPYARRIEDLDFAVSSKQGYQFSRLLESAGFAGDHEFNSIHGETRMLFSSELTDIDVFVEEFAQCHKMNLAKTFKKTKSVIPLSCLVLTKLQVVEINRKDIMNILALLHDHPLSDQGSDEEILSIPMLKDVLGSDWGWYTTVTDNISKIRKMLPELGLKEDEKLLNDRLEQFGRLAESFPKSLKWKLRAKIGRSVPWYELPEEKKL